jgi:hypothetical protein
MGLTLGVGTLALASLLPGVAAALVTRTQSAIVNMSPRASSSQLVGETGGAILTVLILILPLACLVLVAGVAEWVLRSSLPSPAPTWPQRRRWRPGRRTGRWTPRR